MSTVTERIPHDTLDACHRDMLVQLDALAALAQRVQDGEPDAAARDAARRIEAFFSRTAQPHHALEESTVFPKLLAEGSAELVRTVRSLQQDHGWIEENWLELSPQLVALASGFSGFEPAEFSHAVEVFADLCRRHIALEETVVYPRTRAQ